MRGETGSWTFLLFAVLLVLKLLGKISISWEAVTAPLWVPMVVWLGAVLVVWLVGVVGWLIFRKYK